ncbi:cupin domain-containing protein [Clostridium cochlearium]|uniref:Cupin domain-containing protein n=1 Tax=Clostridium cochlearium TaxID=1494 RepID=A0A2X2YB56_CLOCO|nr:cupin domain-containing protein [Clostridium cochlearium]SQB35159.1 cupin domain-containing protein [Clostridium cochlearium]
MIEKTFNLSKGNEKAVEKVIFDENIHYLHMLFNENEGLPEHYSNSNVYMTVIRGVLSIALDEQEAHEYSYNTLLKIPEGTKMNVKNLHKETLEIIVVKAPAPKA